MSRYPQRPLLDTDSLQADVMRFMAIIAFCLIAILALVEKLESPAPETEAVLSPPMPGAPSINDATRGPSLPEVPDPVAVKIQPAPEPVSTPPAPSVANIDEPDKTPRPLTLRFSSEKAFLALIASEEITLVTRINDEFLQLTRAFTVAPIAISGDLYEITRLPERVRRVFLAHGSPDGYLVRLPPTTAASINQLHSTHASTGGELIINRYGNVHYESSY